MPAPRIKDDLYERIRAEAHEAEEMEPALSGLLRTTVLHETVTGFEQAVALVVSHRLIKTCGPDPDIEPEMLRAIFCSTLSSGDSNEMGHTASKSIREDALACVRRDPACETLLEAILFFKGFASLVCHRVARRCWLDRSRFCALWIESQASAAFGVDIHPAADIGCGVMLDHGTGIVIGETAAVGDGCTLLHGTTLGGTGKTSGDRHPKVGKHVLIGAGSSILGNISIGEGAKIGAGSIVLRPVPRHATAVGVPAKVVGWSTEEKPGSMVDTQLNDVQHIGENVSSMSPESSTSSLTTFDESDDQASTSQTEAANASSRKKTLSTTIKARRRSTYSPFDPNVCVFRGIRVKRAPPDAVTYCTLLPMLLNVGCTDAEIGNIYMSLLHQSPKPELGYVPRDVFDRCFREVAEECSTLGEDQIDDIVGTATLSNSDTRISYCTLRNMLIEEGCGEDEVREVYTSLLKNDNKSQKDATISRETFKANFEDFAKEFTFIDPSRCHSIALSFSPQ